MNNFTIKLFLATIALNAAAFGAQQENILSILRKRQLGQRDNGLQEFVDPKLRPYVAKEIPQEELPITFNDYQRLKGVTVVGATVAKELSHFGLRLVIFSLPEDIQRNFPSRMFSINNLNGIERLSIYEADVSGRITEELGTSVNLDTVELLNFANTSITIPMNQARMLKKIFPMLRCIKLASSVQARQDEINIDAENLGIALDYMPWPNGYAS